VKQKLAILLWSATIDKPQLVATPFVHAAAAASALVQRTLDPAWATLTY
jgi:hypothetical protein